MREEAKRNTSREVFHPTTSTKGRTRTLLPPPIERDEDDDIEFSSFQKRPLETPSLNAKGVSLLLSSRDEGAFLVFFKLASALVLSVVTVGWMWASRRRARFHHHRSIKTSDFVTAETAGEEEGVGVVLPVRGVVSNRTRDNWHTQLETKHRGEVAFVFVVEQETDDAKEAAERFVGGASSSVERGGRRSARVVVSGSAENCSQKIRQQLRGAEELGAMMGDEDEDDGKRRFHRRFFEMKEEQKQECAFCS